MKKRVVGWIVALLGVAVVVAGVGLPILHETNPILVGSIELDQPFLGYYYIDVDLIIVLALRVTITLALWGLLLRWRHRIAEGLAPIAAWWARDWRLVPLAEADRSTRCPLLNAPEATVLGLAPGVYLARTPIPFDGCSSPASPQVATVSGLRGGLP